MRAVNVLIDLGTLEPSVNRYIVEKALEFSIRSLHGQQVDRMEVKALVDLTNKTMSKFPFRLPKNLALYMRMSSILEGIYHHHKVKFQFVKVLADILAEEGLLREAYVEETKDYFKRLVKGMESYYWSWHRFYDHILKRIYARRRCHQEDNGSLQLALSVQDYSLDQQYSFTIICSWD